MAGAVAIPQGSKLRALRLSLRQSRPLLEAMGAEMRAIIDEEFRRGAEYETGRSWRPRIDFGDLQRAGASDLQRSGALRRAWRGVGRGSITRLDRQRITIGVSGAALPYAAPVRSGRRIRTTERQRAFLRGHGVYLRADSSIRIPARPHARPGAKARGRLAGAVLRAWSTML